MALQASIATFPFTNRILQSLPPDLIQRLQLHHVHLPRNTPIERIGDPMEFLYFLEAGAASMTTTFEDGSQVEVGLFGYESVLCVSALMGTRRSLNRVYMQLEGHGYTSYLPVARAEFLRAGLFHNLILRSVQAQLSQVAQSTGCNAKHHIEQRLARWLLLCADRARSMEIAVSQEFLATMLGVRRVSASEMIRRFTRLGLIDHHRRHIRILDAKGLEKKACECYRAVKQHLDNSTEFESGLT